MKVLLAPLPLHQQNVTLLAVTCPFVPCQCLAISLVSPDKASKARFLLQVFCKPLKFFIFCKAVLVLDMDNSVLLPAPHSCCTTLLLPAPHHSCCCCCPHRVAASACIASLLLPTSRHCCCPHRVAAAAHIASLLLPASCRCCCPHRVAAAACIASLLLPASRCVATAACIASRRYCCLHRVASLLLPASRRVATAACITSRRCCCPHRIVSLLPASHRITAAARIASRHCCCLRRTAAAQRHRRHSCCLCRAAAAACAAPLVLLPVLCRCRRCHCRGPSLWLVVRTDFSFEKIMPAQALLYALQRWRTAPLDVSDASLVVGVGAFRGCQHHVVSVTDGIGYRPVW